MKEFRKLKSSNFLYEINKDGVVRNIKSKKILKPYTDKNGYIRYTLDGKHYGRYQLIMEAFGKEKPEWAECIDHINRDRDNSYCGSNGIIGLKRAWKKRKRKTHAISKDGLTHLDFDSILDAAIFIKETNYKDSKLDTIQRSIACVMKRKRNYCYGYFWTYKES